MKIWSKNRNRQRQHVQRIGNEATIMDDWPLLLECYPIPQICSVKRWLLRDEVSTKKTLNCCDLILSQGLSGWYEVLKLATKFKTALILSSGNSWGIVYTPACKRQDSHKIIKSRYFAPFSIFPFYFVFFTIGYSDRPRNWWTLVTWTKRTQPVATSPFAKVTNLEAMRWVLFHPWYHCSVLLIVQFLIAQM